MGLSRTLFNIRTLDTCEVEEVVKEKTRDKIAPYVLRIQWQEEKIHRTHPHSPRQKKRERKREKGEKAHEHKRGESKLDVLKSLRSRGNSVHKHTALN